MEKVLSSKEFINRKSEIRKAGLQTSISNLENSIKLFKKTRKRKESKCRKLTQEINKVIANHSIIMEKAMDVDLLKQKVDYQNKEILH